MNKKLLYLIILIVLSIILSLGIFEILLRLQIVDLPFQGGGHAFKIDKKLLFRSKPGGQSDLDDQGFRLNGGPRDKEAEHRILFSGDSFAFGANVGPDETMAAHLENMLGPGYNVINLGVPGHGPDQSKLLLDEVGKDYDPETVVLSIFPANDFQDIYRNNLFTIAPDGSVQPNSDHVLKRLMPRFQTLLALDLLAYSLFNRRPRYDDLFKAFFDDEFDVNMVLDINSERSREKIKLMRGVLRSFKDSVHSLGAKLVVVIIPSYELIITYGDRINGKDYDKENFTVENAVLKICEDEDIKVINLYPDFMISKNRAVMIDPVSHHLSGLGYKTAAQMIFEGNFVESVDIF